MTKDVFPMTIGEEMVRNERVLLSRVEAGKMMMSADSVKYLVLHCSATRRNQDYSVEQLQRDHKKRGFYDVGYHFYIRKDGTMTQHRFLLVVGHRDLAGTVPKACPCFDAHSLFGFIEEM